MRSLLKWAGIVFLFVVVVGVIAGGGKDTSKPATDSTKSDSAPTKTAPVHPKSQPKAKEREALNADGKFSSSCDLAIPSSFNGDYKLFAVAKLQNTGNVGLVIKVVAVFDQAIGDDVKLRKTVRLRVHKARTVKVSQIVTSDQASAFQDSPGYFENKACRVHVSMTDTFGKPPLV